MKTKVYNNSNFAYYRAQLEETGEPVIIKAPASDHPWLKNLKKSGVIQPKAGVRLEDGFALVLKAFDARPLTQILKREKLEVKEALQVALSLVHTLEELHQHNIIHKDTQPENIFITPGKKHALIVDCSVSIQLPREVPHIHDFRTIDGKLAYISPEQTGRMNRPVDYRTDYYSPGATLYEILTGSLPFGLKDHLELVHSHLARKPLPPVSWTAKSPTWCLKYCSSSWPRMQRTGTRARRVSGLIWKRA